jgi:Tol biopolymer transport system component
VRIPRVATALLLAPACVLSAQMAGMNIGGTRPSVSPDGRYIAYNAARNGDWDVYVMSSDGKDGRRLSDVEEKSFVNLGPPTWLGGQVMIWQRVHDTTRVSFVGPAPSLAGSPRGGEPSPAISVPPDARQIRPSPDGKRLVFVYGRGRAARIAVANLDGSGSHDVTDGTSSVLDPDWSPDGTQIVLTVIDSASHGQIAIANADGSGYHVVTHFDPAEGVPLWAAWSPDGKRLAMQAGHYNPKKIEESTAHIWIVDIASGTARKLAPHATPLLDETPSWYPDGRRIAFQSNRSGVLQVWVMNADGSGARQLTSAIDRQQHNRQR